MIETKELGRKWLGIITLTYTVEGSEDAMATSGLKYAEPVTDLEGKILDAIYSLDTSANELFGGAIKTVRVVLVPRNESGEDWSSHEKTVYDVNKLKKYDTRGLL